MYDSASCFNFLRDTLLLASTPGRSTYSSAIPYLGALLFHPGVPLIRELPFLSLA